VKKKINIPLILVTIIIWGIIVYSIAAAVWFNVEDEQKKETSLDYNFDKKETSENSSFEFEYIEKDPFGSTLRKMVVESTTNQNPVKIEIKKEESVINFSVGGVVINGESKKIVFNDETNSNVVFLTEGDLYQGLKVLRVTKNQVEFLQINTGSKLVSQIQ
jgi:hypothetical protein